MIPRPTLEQSVVSLSDRDEYTTILDMRQAEAPNDVMKLAGSIATMDELLQTLDIKRQ
jgi:hypothetical protein